MNPPKITKAESTEINVANITAYQAWMPLILLGLWKWDVAI
jgi:hypothetical protein